MPALAPQIEVGYELTEWGRMSAKAYGLGTTPHNDGKNGRVSLDPRFVGASLTVFGRVWHRIRPTLEVGAGEFWVRVRGEPKSPNVGKTVTLSSPCVDLSIGMALKILPYLVLELRGGTLWLHSKAQIYSSQDTYLGSMGRPTWSGSARLGIRF